MPLGLWNIRHCEEDLAEVIEDLECLRLQRVRFLQFQLRSLVLLLRGQQYAQRKVDLDVILALV